MENNDNSFLLGSPEFVVGQRVPGKELGPAEVQQFRKERGILPDAQERIYALAEEKGWKIKTEAFPGVNYPTPDEWIQSRIEQGRGTKFYPCFVEDKGEIRFLKIQVGERVPEAGGMPAAAREGKILESELPIAKPKVFDSSAGDNKAGLSYVLMEAVPLNEGRVAKAEEWTPTHARHLAKEIKKLEEAQGYDETLFSRETRIVDRLKGIAASVQSYLPAEVAEGINNFLDEGEIREVPVHGDMTLKNIVISKDGGGKVVDWEMANKGFVGQDAGKLFRNLAPNREAAAALLEEYAGSGDNVDQERLRGMCAGILSDYLADLEWRAKEIIAKGREKEFPQTREEMKGQIKGIAAVLENYRTAFKEWREEKVAA